MIRLRKAASLLLATACIASTAFAQQTARRQAHATAARPLPFLICPSGRPLRIVVYGDMRFTDPSNTSDTHPGVRKWLAQKIGEEKPDLLLLTGDMPFHGSNPDDWKVYFQETALWTQERLRDLSHHRQP